MSFQLLTTHVQWLISGFCHDVNEICALLGLYTVKNGNSVLMFQNNLTRVNWSKKTSSHDDGVIVYKIWTLCNVCYSSNVTFIPLVQCTHLPFSIPCKCYSLVWFISELTYHTYPNTRQEFFLNLTHLKKIWVAF